MITNTQTLKTLTQLSSDLRSEYFKFDRHQDYPDQYPWEPSDAAEFAHLLSLIQNYSPHQFTYKLGDPEFGRELIGYLNDIFGESSNTLNPEVVAAYEKYKEEQQAKAEAEVVKKGFDPKTEAQKRINAIGQVAKNFQRAQQPEIAQKIADSAETISYQAVLSPEASITSTSQLGFTSTSTVAEVSMEMAPLATITYPYSENIESVFLQTTNFLPANIPDSSVTAIASAVTTLKYCATPTPLTNRDYESLIELVVKTEEAETGQRIDIPKESIASIANISPTQTPEQIFQTALKTELTKAGASGQVISGVFKAAPFLYAISSYTPTKPTDSKQEIAGKKSQVFGALAQVVLAQYGIIRPENLQNLSYAWIYSAAQSYYGPDQAFTSRFQNLSVSNPFDNQIVSFFKDQGVGKIKSYVTDTYIQPLATEAFSKFASSSIGQALGLGAKAAVTTGVETAAVGAGEVAAGAAAGTGLAATITGFLTALGIADPEPITKVIIAALALLSTQLKNIVSWLKKQSKNLILLLGGGIALLGGALGMALMGFMGLGIPGMVVGAGVGAVGFTALTGGSKDLSAFASKATAFTGALVGLAAVEIGTTVIIIAISIPIVIALILFIINTSAFVVPPSDVSLSGSVITPGPVAEDCQTNDGPPPAATDIKYSSDNKYAFPMAPFSETYYGCSHWDGSMATDIGIIGDVAANPPSKNRLPIIAYVSGVVQSTSMNDSLGGKYIILSGNDGRYYYYAHSCRVFVKPGDGISVGQVMATSDNTGSAATSVEHLHFAISTSPVFYNGGNICPAADFKEKFNLTNCGTQTLCQPK